MKRYVKAEKLELVRSGRDYFTRLIGIIDNARESLHLQTYIFKADNTGNAVLSSLKAAAARGVQVTMLVDAFGSYPFPRDVMKDLRGSAIKFRLFSPIFSSEAISAGRRLHHKIIVADSSVAMIGGINISEKYDSTPGEVPWLDFALRIEGEVCQYLDLLCDHYYKKLKRFRLYNWENEMNCYDEGKTSRLVRFRRNDWVRGAVEIHKSYLEGIREAKKEVIIVGGYFLPGGEFRRQITAASRRGVQIIVLMAGHSDVATFSFAERYLYDFYLRHKVLLYEWENSMMHGKAMIVDGQWSTIGSYNLNFLSRYQSIELNADVSDEEFCGNFATHVKDIILTRCNAIDLEEHSMRGHIFNRFMMWLAYLSYRSIRAFLIMLGNSARRNSN